MKAKNSFLLIIGLIIVVASCKVAVAPHENKMGDTYCVYKITAVRGGGALAAGAVVCIYCSPPATSKCKSTMTITPAKGIEYDLVNIGNTCTTCSSSNTYQVSKSGTPGMP